MPSLPPVNAVITRIDAPFPEQWREGMYEFTKELGAIKELLGVMAVSQTESKDAQKALSELYTKESVAARASQAILAEQPQQRVRDHEGRPDGASQDEVFRSPKPPRGSPGEERERQEEQEKQENPSRPNILDREITLPQHYGGKYTAQDMLILAGKMARAGGYEDLAGNIGGVAKQVPNFQAGANLIRTYVSSANQMSQGLQSYSASLGYQPGSGTSFLGMPQNNIDLGPLGNFRSPLSSGALSGATSMLGSFGTAMQTPGLSTQQAMAMQQSLAEKGWFPGQGQTNEMFDAQTKLFSKGGVLQELATNPEVMELMEKAMRSGSASIKEITEMVEEVPGAAKTAHVGMAQMVSDMKVYGELAEGQGGTRTGGARQALELVAATGMPAGASMGLLDNPWTQSAIFRQTGMPSWMQGSLPGSVKNQGAQAAFWEAARAVGRPSSFTTKDINGGSSTVSGISQQAAMMKQLPGFEKMSTEQIERRLRGGKNWGSSTQMRTETLGALGNWKDQAESMWQRGITGGKLNAWISGGPEGQMPGGFGHLLTQMAHQMTPDGRHRYSQQDIRTIREAGHGERGEDLIKAKYDAVKEVIESKASKQSNNQEGSSVTIELSPHARKFLQLPNKKSQQKLSTNGGSGEPLNHAYTGFTDPLTPNAVGAMAASGHGFFTK